MLSVLAMYRYPFWKAIPWGLRIPVVPAGTAVVVHGTAAAAGLAGVAGDPRAPPRGAGGAADAGDAAEEREAAEAKTLRISGIPSLLASRSTVMVLCAYDDTNRSPFGAR